MKHPEEIILVDPATLTLHPAAKDLPELAEDDPDFIALVEGIRANGQRQPIIIEKTNRILDGRHRWRAVKRLKLPTISAIVRPDSEAVQIILESLLQRRHYTKGALAFSAYPMLRAALDEARENREVHSVHDPFTVEAQAERFGISKRLYHQASELHSIFAKDPDYKSLAIADVLSGETGLGAAIAGYAGYKSTKGKPKPKDDKLRLINRVFDDQVNRIDHWEKLDSDARAEHWTRVRSKISSLTTQQCNCLLNYHRQLIKELIKAAKETL